MASLVVCGFSWSQVRRASQVTQTYVRQNLVLPTKEALTSGVPFPLGLPGVEQPTIFEPQFTIDVPAGSESLWIELNPDDVSQDFDMFINFGAPVDLSQAPPRYDLLLGTYIGYEEVGIWAPDLQAGTYYIMLASVSLVGGNMTLTATVNGAFVDLTSGKKAPIRVPADVTPPGDLTITPDGQQFRIQVPDGAAAAYIRLESEDLDYDTNLIIRNGQHIVFPFVGPLEADRIVDGAGGFEEICLRPPDLVPGQHLYFWVFNDAGVDQLVEGGLTATIDGCSVPVVAGQTVTGMVMGAKEAASLVIAGFQYPVTVEEPLAPLTITAQSSGDPQDVDFFVRKDAPVDVDDQGVPVADFSALSGGTDPEVLVIDCETIAPGVYYIAPANANQFPLTFTLSVEAGDSCVTEPPGFIRGDANRDGDVNIADAVAILGRLFGTDPPLQCEDAADANDDEDVNLADGVYILQYIFINGPVIPPPYPRCGIDPTSHPDPAQPDLPECNYCPEACEDPPTPCPQPAQ